jgi:uncharacterized protein (DUF952 family)
LLPSFASPSIRRQDSRNLENPVRLFHIVPAVAFPSGHTLTEYTPATFEHDGFIHCSYERQVVEVANRLFRGRRDLLLVEIDPAKLVCQVVDENLEGGSELYPHVYGSLPLEAVVHVHRFPCAEDGRFELPPGYNSTPLQS